MQHPPIYNMSSQHREETANKQKKRREFMLEWNGGQKFFQLKCKETPLPIFQES